MAQSRPLYGGMEVQKEASAVASVAPDQGAEVLSRGTIGPRQGAMEKLRRPLQAQGPQRGGVYAAGPCGSWRSRSRMTKGAVCWGVAPSLMPHKPGARGKTARRDARPLARRMRSGDLPPGDGPAIDDAARRALRRARDETRRALTAATRRRTAFWRRPDLRETGRATWRPAHLRWLSEVGWPTPAPPSVLHEDGQTGTAQTARLGRRARARHEPVPTWRCAPGGAALPALRGGQFPVAVTTGAAWGDLPRFEPPRPRRHELGLTPSAYASGGRRQQGSRTTPGKTQARRALVAGAWASRYPATGRRPLPLRLEKLPPASQALSWQAQGWLCPRERPRRATGQNAPQVGGAMARA